jgi:hypothetical protein
MSRLGKPVNDYPDGVKLVGRERQTHNKIHADVFHFKQEYSEVAAIR